MEYPISRRLVLPLTRFKQIADDRQPTGTAHVLGRLHRFGETEHVVAAGHEDLDQLRTKEPSGTCDKRGRSRVDWHVASVVRQRSRDHPQRPHSTRTIAQSLNRRNVKPAHLSLAASPARSVRVAHSLRSFADFE